MTQPGFELAVHAGGRLKRELGTELLELQEALSAAQTDYMLAQAPGMQAPMERATFVLGELNATLEFLFDDGREDENDARLAALQEAHRDSLSQDARALALEGFAGPAQLHRDRMSGLGGFEVALIDEAPQLAKGLREQSAGKLVGEPTNAQKAALDLRNRIATLLYGRMNQVRNAARSVFRGQPEVVKKVTSAYQRRRRAETRKGAEGAEGVEEGE